MILSTRSLILAIMLLAAATATAEPTHPARYRVTFTATWSAETHPQDFPPNPHFSWLIGGTHDAAAVFWAVGDTATLGMERMAEWGSTTPLDLEVGEAITAGQAGEVIESATYPASPGTVSAEFTATPDYPLATVVTMVAPSPDWFTGVAGLDLRDGDAWADEITVEMWPYDAGTDSGTTYTAGNNNTSPRDPVVAITGAPFSPGVSLGTLSFTLLTSATNAPDASRLALKASPNPFNPRTTISFSVPHPGPATVTVHDLRGRAVRSLWSGSAEAGRFDVVWNGRDDRGRELPSATYVIRLTGVDTVSSTRITLAR
jgi:hypothetical protein